MFYSIIITLLVSLTVLSFGLLTSPKLRLFFENNINFILFDKRISFNGIVIIYFLLIAGIILIYYKTDLIRNEIKEEIGIEFMQAMPKTYQEQLLIIQSEIEVGRTFFENFSIAKSSINFPEDILVKLKSEGYRNVSNIITELERISVPDKDFGYRIKRYDLLAYSIAIATEYINESDIANQLIREGLISIDSTFSLIQNIENQFQHTREQYLSAILKYIKEDNTIDRLYTLQAWLMAKSFLLDGILDPSEKEKILGILDNISNYYRLTYSLEKNPTLGIFYR